MLVGGLRDGEFSEQMVRKQGDRPPLRFSDCGFRAYRFAGYHHTGMPVYAVKELIPMIKPRLTKKP